jgi:hypothetical protein
MTPAEFRSLAKARISYHEQQRDILDSLNARACQITAAAAGVENPKMKDFTIFMEDRPEPAQSEEAWNRSLERWGILGSRV